MLYSRRQLSSPYFDHQTAMSRYLNKYLNQKSEFKRLKAHEKDYVFEWANHILDNQGNPIINLYEEPLASEYLFYRIILTYGEDVDSFNGRFTDHKGVIPENQVQKDKSYFDTSLSLWKKLIHEHKGPDLSIIEPMLRRKLDELKRACKTDEEYCSREKYCYAVFFYLYYKAKIYFDELKKKALVFWRRRDQYTQIQSNISHCVAVAFACKVGDYNGRLYRATDSDVAKAAARCTPSHQHPRAYGRFQILGCFPGHRNLRRHSWQCQSECSTWWRADGRYPRWCLHLRLPR